MSTLFEAANMAIELPRPPAEETPQQSVQPIEPPALEELDEGPVQLAPVGIVAATSFQSIPEKLYDTLAHRFLEQGVTTQSLSHGFIFKGKHTQLMYESALLLAKVLNCKQPPAPAEACGTCTHCRWIAQNQHPAVMTLSRLSTIDDEVTYKKMKERKKPLTRISVDQVNFLIRKLSMRSDDYRVVIVTDIVLSPRDEDTLLNPVVSHEMIQTLELVSGRHQVNFSPLSRAVFDDSATNKLLKTLEEPTGRTVFIFLTHQEDQLIDTIVSRCQLLPFTVNPDPVYGVTLSNSALQEYVVGAMGKIKAGSEQATITPEHWQSLIQGKLMSSSERSLDAQGALEALMAGVYHVYILPSLASKPVDKPTYQQGCALLRCINTAQRQLSSNVNSEGVISRLRYALADALISSSS